MSGGDGPVVIVSSVTDKCTGHGSELGHGCDVRFSASGIDLDIRSVSLVRPCRSSDASVGLIKTEVDHY